MTGWGEAGARGDAGYAEGMPIRHALLLLVLALWFAGLAVRAVGRTSSLSLYDSGLSNTDVGRASGEGNLVGVPRESGSGRPIRMARV